MNYYNNDQQAPCPGRFISQNLRPLAAVKILVQTNQDSIIYPIRKPPQEGKDPQGKNTFKKGDLIFDPVNHDGGSPTCTISLQSWQNGTCAICKKNIPNDKWYFDVTLSIIAHQYQNKPNSRDIIECVKFYKDGEYEILYTQFEEASLTEVYIENDPIMTALLEVQNIIVQQASTRENVILEQNPEMIEKFKDIINEALQ